LDLYRPMMDLGDENCSCIQQRLRELANRFHLSDFVDSGEFGGKVF
jgi:hypothetical protein